MTLPPFQRLFTMIPKVGMRFVRPPRSRTLVSFRCAFDAMWVHWNSSFDQNGRIIARQSLRQHLYSTTRIQGRKCSTVSTSSSLSNINSNNPNNHHPSSQQLWESMSPSTQQLAFTISNSSHHREPTSTPPMGSDGDFDFKEMHPRVAIGRAITLMESKHPAKKKQGDLLLTYLLSLESSASAAASSSSAAAAAAATDNNFSNFDDVDNDHNDSTTTLNFPPHTSTASTLRVGIAGPPGAGKSTLTEAFGMHLLKQYPDLKLAVVCIDPSSNVSGGSILGDKTRMTQLSRHDRAVIRPSSTSGVLGGLAAYTDDVVRLLGCAGYPLVLVETVGLGQSEIEVAESVDVLVLAVPPSGGDELQGVKKGIVEMANILIVTKADGDLEAAANRTASDYSGALSVLQQIIGNIGGCDGHDQKLVWKPPVLLTSSVTLRGLDDLWNAILGYRNYLLKSGKWDTKRHGQAKYWMWKQFTRMMQLQMQQDPQLAAMARQLEAQLLDGYLTPRVAAQELLDGFFRHTRNNKA